MLARERRRLKSSTQVSGSRHWLFHSQLLNITIASYDPYWLLQTRVGYNEKTGVSFISFTNGCPNSRLAPLGRFWKLPARNFLGCDLMQNPDYDVRFGSPQSCDLPMSRSQARKRLLWDLFSRRRQMVVEWGVPYCHPHLCYMRRVLRTMTVMLGAEHPN